MKVKAGFSVLNWLRNVINYPAVICDTLSLSPPPLPRLLLGSLLFTFFPSSQGMSICDYRMSNIILCHVHMAVNLVDLINIDNITQAKLMVFEEQRKK